MCDSVHFIPVGFDLERLIHPISQGDLNAEKVILFHSSRSENEDAAQLAESIVEELKTAFSTYIGADVQVETLDDIYDYSEIYKKAHRRFKEEIEDGNAVHVNISSMPRTVAFAFATAADSLIIENKEYRNRIQTYYASPERYLILDLIEELGKEKEFLKNHSEELSGTEAEERIESIESLLTDIKRFGVTRGTSSFGDSNYVEFPAPPVKEPRDFEEELLRFLDSHGPLRSISALARKLAESNNEEMTDSFRSKVQYNVESLEEDGYLNKEDKGKRHEVSLSKMGKLWTSTH